MVDRRQVSILWQVEGVGGSEGAAKAGHWTDPAPAIHIRGEEFLPGNRTPTGIFQILNKDGTLVELDDSIMWKPELSLEGSVTTPEEVTKETRSDGDLHILNAGKPGAPEEKTKE